MTLASKPSRRQVIAIMVVIVAATWLAALGWRIQHSQHASSSLNIIRSPRIVSLVPQATQILVSMGCADHLAAVSNFDNEPEITSLPRVGDYYTIDWETIGSLRPQWIVTKFGAGRAPPGFVDHAAALSAEQLNVQTETLNGPPETTVDYAIDALGRIAQEPVKAAAARARLRRRLSAVADSARGRPPVRTLLIIGAEGTMLAGRDTFLNELLELAGGQNAAAGLAGRYPNVDREQLANLAPEAIIQLMPDGSPQVLHKAEQQWASLPGIPAVKNHRVTPLTQWYVLLPGDCVADTAELFAIALHKP